MTALETMLSVKFGAGLYPQPCPRAVKIAWAAAAAALVGGLGGWQCSLWREGRREQRQQQQQGERQQQQQQQQQQKQQQQQQQQQGERQRQQEGAESD